MESLHRSSERSGASILDAEGIRNALAVVEPLWMTTRGESMWPTWRSGSLLLVQAARYRDLRVGDCIVYEHAGEILSHRLIGKRKRSGCEEFLTKADSVSLAEPWQDARCFLGRIIAFKVSPDSVQVDLRGPHERLLGWKERTRATLHSIRSRLFPISRSRLIPAVDLSAESKRTTWANNQLLLTHAQQTILGLRSKGIEAVLLKGLAHLLQGWNDPESRPCADIDLWVHPKHATTAIEYLASCGWAPAGPDEQLNALKRHKIVLKNAIGLYLDLHWSLINCGWRLRPAFNLTAAAVQGEIRKVSAFQINVLSPEASLLYAMMHLTLSGGRGGKWWRELEVWLRSGKPAIDWERFVELAKTWKAKTIAWAVLDTLARSFGVPVPVVVIQQLKPSILHRNGVRALLPSSLENPHWEWRALRYMRELFLVDSLGACGKILSRVLCAPVQRRTLKLRLVESIHA